MGWIAGRERTIRTLANNTPEPMLSLPKNRHEHEHDHAAGLGRRPRPDPLPDGGSEAAGAALWQIAELRPFAAAPRQHLDRRDHARVGLLLLRRDARAGTASSASAAARSRADAVKSGGFGGHRERHLQGVRLAPRDGAVQRAQGGREARHREEHREDLPPERAEHRPPDEHRLRPRSRASRAARRSR